MSLLNSLSMRITFPGIWREILTLAMEDFEDAYADELEMLREFDGMYTN